MYRKQNEFTFIMKKKSFQNLKLQKQFLTINSRNYFENFLIYFEIYCFTGFQKHKDLRLFKDKLI